ncbi:bifunctional pyr operon transcriptional regulator/uracil phosphoribosyltransferase PyrR [Curtobacterium sp. MCBD17_030]|uniref:bifunctional pyr operon transcriptional regulator/uracil phosphoribosyltransferase PyrR n=1 Tax=Curtobacterium sp. MCBD17_030 TaxID=2175649 RepID=UPI000D814506|nr:bifunctional pyr operon transcriptional regulator/uracil phosphoribosyltransferase PyrR [Curtobacterium sp. MCBD17_030]PYY38453.1 bifunctional pyr operon transcriptional regulator/uracil phosphoribosyltransferase PyrR [Curtobacterium sp. MCBD17_030]
MGTRTVLQQPDITRALTRIAHEILEANHGGSELVLLGIPTRGAVLAERLGRILADIEPGWESAAAGIGSERVGALDVTMYRDDLRRGIGRAPHPTVIPAGGVDGRVVVLVDDVLYSGRTVRAALDALQGIGRPRAVRLAVLVDRGHRELPIRADHVGKNLPTAGDERVTLHLTETDGVDDVVIEQGGTEQGGAS